MNPHSQLIQYAHIPSDGSGTDYCYAYDDMLEPQGGDLVIVVEHNHDAERPTVSVRTFDAAMLLALEEPRIVGVVVGVITALRRRPISIGPDGLTAHL